MKKLVCISIALFIGKAASAQLSFPDAQSVISFVSGTWDWTKSCGGITGGCSTPLTTGMTRAVQFSPYGSDSLIWTDYVNGSVTGTQNIYVHYDGSMSTWVFEDLNGGYMQPFSAMHQDTIEFPGNMTDEFARSAPSGLDISGPAKSIRMYPNPATDHLSLTPANGAIRICEIYDMLGTKVMAVKNSACIDIGTLSKGMYLVCAEDESGRYMQRFVKE